MSDVLNFAGMSERQQLRYLQQQAEAAANPQPVEEPAPPKKKKRKKVPKPAEKEFVVEAILDKQICPDTGSVKYLVLWKGYGPEESSWEPAANLIGCDAALAKFEQSRRVAPKPCKAASSGVKAPQVSQPLKDDLPVNDEDAYAGIDLDASDDHGSEPDSFDDMDQEQRVKALFESSSDTEHSEDEMGKSDEALYPSSWVLSQGKGSTPIEISDALALVVGAGPLPESEILGRLWKYIQQHNLALEGLLKCDVILSTLLGVSSVQIELLPTVLAPHLKSEPQAAPDVQSNPIGVSPEEASKIWISRDHLSSMLTQEGQIGELATGCLVRLVHDGRACMAKITSVLEGEPYTFNRKQCQIYLQHVPLSWAQSDVSKLDQVHADASICNPKQEFQAFSKLALFDDDVVISADALEAKQVQLDSFLRNDELARLQARLRLAIDNRQRTQEKELRSEIEKCRHRDEPRPTPFSREALTRDQPTSPRAPPSAPSPRYDDNRTSDVSNYRGRSHNDMNSDHRRGPDRSGDGPVHRDFGSSEKGGKGKGKGKGKGWDRYGKGGHPMHRDFGSKGWGDRGSAGGWGDRGGDSRWRSGPIQHFAPVFSRGQLVCDCEARSVVSTGNERLPFELPREIHANQFKQKKNCRFPDKSNFIYVVPREGRDTANFDSFIQYLQANDAAVVAENNRSSDPIYMVAAQPDLSQRYPGRNLRHCLLAFQPVR